MLAAALMHAAAYSKKMPALSARYVAEAVLDHSTRIAQTALAEDAYHYS
jgi:hypothetical protein